MLESTSNKNETTVYLYGAVGVDFTDKEFISFITKVKTSLLIVRINSPGGNVFQGNGIYNALKNFNGTVHTYIDGIAASMASVIALAGKRVFMSSNAMLMIHNPSMGLRTKLSASEKKVLEKIKGTLINAYKGKTGITFENINIMMNDETWFTADEAKESKFIDEIIPDVFEKSVSARRFVASSNLATTIYNEYKSINNKQTQFMELDQLLALLKLPSDGTFEDCIDAINTLITENEGAKEKAGETKKAKDDSIEAILISAVHSKKISADLMSNYRTLLKNDYRNGIEIINKLPAVTKISAQLDYSGNFDSIEGKSKASWSLEDYRKHAPLELQRNPRLYKQLCEQLGIQDE